MSNPNMSGIPGVGAMTDTLDFVKKMWGGMNIPGMVMPSLSVNDINKQIADLKAVESWLTLNMNMLRGTIQALEVQSATISTLQSMSESMSSMVQPATTSHGGHSGYGSSAAFEPNFSFTPPIAEKPPAPKSDEAPEPKPAPAADGNGAAVAAAAAAVAGAEVAAAGAEAAAMAAQLANPAAWWNMLQDQFKQAVNAAVPEPAPAARTGRAGAKPKTKTPAKGKAKAKAAPRKAKAPPKP